ncbi:MAG: DUF4383 domain-containing protein [Pyrinomonadaceae bacterium]
MIRKFALIAGIIYVLGGLSGFVPAMTPHSHDMSPIAVDSFYGRALGLFPVNILHNLVHLAIGAWGLIASRSLSGARMFGRGLAIFYGLLAILGLIPATNTMFGLVPLYGHDIWLHAGTALIAAYFGFVAREDDDRAGARS